MQKTVINQRMQALPLSIAELAKAANLHTPLAYCLRKGGARAGEDVRQRLATALRSTPEELFDADGWPRFAEQNNEQSD